MSSSLMRFGHRRRPSMGAISLVTITTAGPSDLAPTETQQLTAHAFNADQHEISLVGRQVRWSSSNASIATVNALTGLVTAVADGACTISVVVDGVTVTTAANITVATAGGGGGGGSTFGLPDLFHDAWTIATPGTGAAKVMDGTVWDGAGTSSTGLTVSGVETVATAGLDARWPTSQCFMARCYHDPAGTPTNWGAAQCWRNLGTPVNGDDRYFRVYVDVKWADSHGSATTSNVEHGIESTGPTGSGHGFNPMLLPRNNGTFFMAWREITSGERYVAAAISAPKNTTLRLEWHLHYNATGYTVEIRLYQVGANEPDDDILLATEADFFRTAGPADNAVLSGRTIVLSDFSMHSRFQVGCNGPTSNFPGVSGTPDIATGQAYRAYTGVGVGTDDWLGPYDPVTG